jgi:hypothetical protein
MYFNALLFVTATVPGAEEAVNASFKAQQCK